MMQNKGTYLAAADHELNCDVLQLPYKGNISMLIAMPQKLSGMKILEQEVSPTIINKWLNNMTNRYGIDKTICNKFGWDRYYKFFCVCLKNNI